MKNIIQEIKNTSNMIKLILTILIIVITALTIINTNQAKELERKVTCIQTITIGKMHLCEIKEKSHVRILK